MFLVQEHLIWNRSMMYIYSPYSTFRIHEYVIIKRYVEMWTFLQYENSHLLNLLKDYKEATCLLLLVMQLNYVLIVSFSISNQTVSNSTHFCQSVYSFDAVLSGNIFLSAIWFLANDYKYDQIL